MTTTNLTGEPAKLFGFIPDTGTRKMRAQRLELLEDIAQVLQIEKADLMASLRRVADRNIGKPIEQPYRRIMASINQGKDNGLSDALRPYFPEQEFMLVKAFDQGAKNDAQRGAGFDTAVRILRPLAALRSDFTKLMLSFMGAMVMVLAMWLGAAPSFANILTDLLPRDKWFLFSRIVIESAEFVLATWFIMGPVAVAGIAWVVWAMPNWKGSTRRWCDGHVPGFVIYREFHSVMTLVSLACFIKANIGLDWAFSQLIRLSTPWQVEYVTAIHGRTKQYGASKMVDVGYFPDAIINRVALREGSASLSDNLESVALQNIEGITKIMTVKLQNARLVLGDLTKLFGGAVVISIVLLILASVQLTTSLKG